MGSTDPSINTGLDRLHRFWKDAQLPPDRLPYLEFQSRRYASIVHLLGGHGRLDGKRTLDLGGGVGSLAVTLHDSLGGEFAIADYFEPTAAHRAALREAGVTEAYRCDLTDADPLSGVPTGFDLVLLVEVLEHLLINPMDLFRSIADHLGPQGSLFLTTPNPARLTNRWKLLLGRSIKEEGRYPTDGSRIYGHVIEYSVGELERLLAVEGFRPVEVRVVQQVPTARPSEAQRLGVRALNSSLLRRRHLGDDILGLYRLEPPAALAERRAHRPWRI